MALFDEDVLAAEPTELLDIKPVMTILAGQVVWES